jgi:two-component system LytT family sensor kinase
MSPDPKPRVREPLFISLPAYLAIATCVGIALSFQWYVLFNHRKTFLEVAAVTLTTTYIWASFGLLVWELVQRLSFKRGSILVSLAAYAGAAVLLLWAHQLRFYFLGGFGNPRESLTYTQNFAFFFEREALFYLAIYVAAILLFRGVVAQRQVQRMKLDAAQLEKELIRMELLNLRSRLQPHFFFNALNTISAFVHDDPKLADQSIELLSHLMRRNIECSTQETTTLSEELQAAVDFLNFQQIRFRGRMEYSVQTQPGSASVLVPTQILQPIVENCVTHAVESSTELTVIAIHCSRSDNRVRIEVTNTLHADPSRPGLGTGLNSVQKRLELLYGKDAELKITRAEQEFKVLLIIPVLPNRVEPRWTALE